MKGGNFGKLLIAQVLVFLLPQFGESRTGNGNRGVLAIDKKDAIDGVTMPGGDGREKVDKSDLRRVGERLRTNFKRRNDIAHRQFDDTASVLNWFSVPVKPIDGVPSMPGAGQNSSRPSPFKLYYDTAEL
jgi:hypothetical protein